MTTLTEPAATASSAGTGTDLAAGEVYIELVPARHGEPHQVSFPAVIEPRRHHGLWVRPRLRRETAEQICDWLNLVYPVDPDWYPLARVENDLLVVFTGDTMRDRHEIPPAADGRYPLGDLGCWFLSIPTRTAEQRQQETAIVGETSRWVCSAGETWVSCHPHRPGAATFPAHVEPSPARSNQDVLIFRREVAEALVAWCNIRHRDEPDDYPQAYFAGDTLVHVHQHRRAHDGYTPWRIDPDDDGRYRIDSDAWTFQIVRP